MIIQCTEKDREMLVSFLRKDPVYNTFILADIEDLGFDSSVQTVYAEVEGGECVGVYLCFYKNLLISCEENRTNVDFLWRKGKWFVRGGESPPVFNGISCG